MPEIQIRPAFSTDMPSLIALDHSCETDYVWQMDVHREKGQNGVVFREIRLPRSVTVPYPRQVSGIPEAKNSHSGVLVALVEGATAGYVRLNDTILDKTAWLLDLVVSPRFRRQGIASGLVMASHAWAIQRKNHRALMEMSSKNHPAIKLAQKLGYEFCGYNDQYYERQDVALFFGRPIR